MSMALFGAEVPRLPMDLGWPKQVPGSEGPEIKAYHYIGIGFDHHVKAQDLSPRVLELTAEEEVDGTVVFQAAEVDAARGNQINECVNAEH